jgi:hypothetical protein
VEQKLSFLWHYFLFVPEPKSRQPNGRRGSVRETILCFPDPLPSGHPVIVYYESIKRELKIKPIYECWCDERLKTKAEESTCLGYTGLFGELEDLKIKTRLLDEKFASVMGEETALGGLLL